MVNNNLAILGQWDIFNKKLVIYGDSEKPLFLVVDVLAWIGYEKDSANKLLKLVDASEKLTGTIFRSGQNRKCWFLTEDGLYEVLMQSRKPIAKQFKTKVKEILKEIRRTGKYSVRPQQQSLEPSFTPAVRTYRVWNFP